jgi:hypothetical protein
MAIFATNCAICGEAISEFTPNLMTSGVAFPPEHPLYPFCDAGLHQNCLLTWPHRREFAAGYFGGSGHSLERTSDWNLICGPLLYGPGGRPGWPYYAEIRLADWPIRLYSRFESWGEMLASQSWRRWCIAELSSRIEQLSPEFPATHRALRLLLLPSIVKTMISAEEHRSRYIAAVSLDLYGDAELVQYVADLRTAQADDHASVRQTATRILKRIQSP